MGPGTRSTWSELTTAADDAQMKWEKWRHPLAGASTLGVLLAFAACGSGDGGASNRQ